MFAQLPTFNPNIAPTARKPSVSLSICGLRARDRPDLSGVKAEIVEALSDKESSAYWLIVIT